MNHKIKPQGVIFNIRAYKVVRGRVHEPSDALETTRHSFFDNENFLSWACDQLKLINVQRITLKNTSSQGVVHLSPRYSHVTLVSGYLFWQLPTDRGWMSTIKLNTDCPCPGHPASNARSLQQNRTRLVANQRARTVVAHVSQAIL